MTTTKRFHYDTYGTYVAGALPFKPPPWLATRHHTTTPKLLRFTTPPSLFSYATSPVNPFHYIHRPPTPSSLLTTPALTVLHTHPTFLLTKKFPSQPQPHSTPAPFPLNNTIPPYYRHTTGTTMLEPNKHHTGQPPKMAEMLPYGSLHHDGCWQLHGQ